MFLQVEDIHVTFPARGQSDPVHAVRGVSFGMEEGSIVGLVGESGCGKTTLSRCIMQLRLPTAGRIILQGKNLTALPPREILAHRPDFQMVFQDPYASLNPRHTVFSTLAEAAAVRGDIPRHALADRVAELMSEVGLNPAGMRKYPHEFSGGQRQRIAIARALAPRPKLLIADEPVSALDVSVQAQILNLLNDLRDRFNLTMLFISHDLSVVHYLADQILVMREGEIVESGEAEKVFTDPEASYTRELLAAVPKIEAG